MNFIDKLEYEMQKKNIGNLHILSEKCDIPYTTLKGFYDRGTEKIQRLTLKKLADYFKCTTDYLIYDEINEPSGTYPELIAKDENAQPIENPTLERFQILYDKMKYYPEESQKMLYNVTESIMKEIDEQLDGKE